MENDIVKITNAVYRLLDYLPDADPLKNKAKEKALAVLENVSVIFENHGWVLLKNYLSQDRERRAATVVADIAMLENYLALAKSQGWIGGMNFLIIKKYYEELRQEIISKNQPVRKLELPAPVKPVQSVQEKPKRTAPLIVEYTTRQKSILQLLQVQGKVQVADIIKKIPSVTKRTVRRDLDDLLKKKAIIRMGEFNRVFYQKG